MPESKAQRSHIVNKWLILYMVVYFVFAPTWGTKLVPSVPSAFILRPRTCLTWWFAFSSPEGAFSTIQVILMHTKVENRCTGSLCIFCFPGLICSFNTSLLLTDTTLILCVFLINLRMSWNHVWYLSIDIQGKNILLLSYLDFKIVLFFYNWNKCFYPRNKICLY